MRVLVVEDEASQQETLGIVLTVTGHTVLQARDVSEAFILLDCGVDAAILDVVLPDPEGLERDGLSILQALRTKHPAIPVAVFTGVPLSDEQLEITQGHAARVLHKPQTFDIILDWLDAASGSGKAASR